MTHPSTVIPQQWMRTFPMHLIGIMSCHWTDIERGHVMPKYAGQIFQFVDLNECWMYLGEPITEDPEPVRSGWGTSFVLIACLALAGIEGFLLWRLYIYLSEMGVL